MRSVYADHELAIPHADRGAWRLALRRSRAKIRKIESAQHPQKKKTMKTKDPHQDPALLEPLPIQHLRGAIDESESVTEKIKVATAAANEAKAQVAQHEAVTAEARLIQSEWKQLCDDLVILQERLVRADDQVSTAQRKFEKKRDHLNGYIGGIGTNEEFERVATLVATVGSAIPILSEARKHLQAQAREHLAKVIAFAQLHKIPRATIDRLSVP